MFKVCVLIIRYVSSAMCIKWLIILNDSTKILKKGETTE